MHVTAEDMPQTLRGRAPPVLLLRQGRQRCLGGVDEQRHVGEGGARSDVGHQGRSRAVRMVQDQAIGNAAVRLQRALFSRQHGDGERHGLAQHMHNIAQCIEQPVPPHSHPLQTRAGS